MPFSIVCHYNQLTWSGAARDREMMGLLEQWHFGIVAPDFDVERAGRNYSTEECMAESTRFAAAVHGKKSIALAMPEGEKLWEEAKSYIWAQGSGFASPLQPTTQCPSATREASCPMV